MIGAVLLGQLSAGVPAAASMTDRERQRLIAHLEMTASWLIDEVAGLSPRQLAFRRAAGGWTILEVVDHLVVVGDIYWNDLQRAVKTNAEGTSRMTDGDILWYGIDRTNRETAIPPEMPKGLRELRPGLDTYRKQHERLLQYVRTTQDDLRQRYVERQRCDAYQWALLISTHEQRHILQIREITADRGFPGS